MTSVLPAGRNLVDVAELAIRAAHIAIKREFVESPDHALDPEYIEERDKTLVYVDYLAQKVATPVLKENLSNIGIEVCVIGEESPVKTDHDISKEQRLVALVDMLDGTDLLIRGLGNWCSAIIFYAPPALCGDASSPGKILAWSERGVNSIKMRKLFPVTASLRQVVTQSLPIRTLPQEGDLAIDLYNLSDIVSSRWMD